MAEGQRTMSGSFSIKSTPGKKHEASNAAQLSQKRLTANPLDYLWAYDSSHGPANGITNVIADIAKRLSE